MFDYFIDLKLPIACKDCGYRCCSNHYKTCYKPIFSGEFCNRDKVAFCSGYPLKFNVNGRFAVSECLGEKFLPRAKLESITSRLNKLHPFKEFHYVDEEVVLHVFKEPQIKSFEDDKQSFYESLVVNKPLHLKLQENTSQKLICESEELFNKLTKL
ncbi:hypothetical protein GF352_03205 [archaeon]|nr:hypothetical protein [archaeon]